MKKIMKRVSRRWGAWIVFPAAILVGSIGGCSGCHESNTSGDSDAWQEDLADSHDFTDQLDVTEPGDPDAADGLDGFDPAIDRDAYEPFPDPGDPDPWVPDSWDVPFDYMDIPADYVPDPAGCGNGVVDPGEECDDGNDNDHDECTSLCLFPRCGDGFVWSGMEDCDPPGSVRRCTTDCGTVGGEWCETFCRWTGECVPPREACGNRVDDDCDGVTDLIVRETPNVTVSDRPIRNYSESRIVWTGSEFAVLWQSYVHTVILTRLDRWGRRVDWDRDLVDDPSGVYDFYWTGSLMSMLWSEERGSTYDLLYQAMDPGGSAVSPPVDIVSRLLSYGRLHAAWSGDLLGIVMENYVDSTPALDPHYSFFSVSTDGSSVSDEMVLGDYMRVYPECLTWTGSEFAMLYVDEDVYGGTGSEKRIDFISPEGFITRTVHAEGDPYEDEYDCTWTDSRMAVAASVGEEYLTLHFLAEDGSLAADAPIAPLTMDEVHNIKAVIVWTGSETGLFWSDSRSGNSEIYFARVGAAGARLIDDVRLTRTTYDSTLVSAAWTGSSYGVTWNDSDGVDVDVYFAHFLPCP
jgi:cysteine-rich repeat protein